MEKAYKFLDSRFDIMKKQGPEDMGLRKELFTLSEELIKKRTLRRREI